MLKKLTRSYAHYQPQKWVGDTAVDVYAAGENTWELSREDLDQARVAVAEGDDLDFLAQSGTSPVPAWIKNFDGPFEIFLEDKGD